MTIREWVAVFYPHKFYVGRVIDLPENGNPSLKFLERRPGDVFEYRSDTEEVERQYIFRRHLRVGMKGKTGFSIPDYGGIEKDYQEFKKKYLLEGKVRSQVAESSFSLKVKINCAEFSQIFGRHTKFETISYREILMPCAR